MNSDTLFSRTLVEENTMNLSKRSGDKELFYGTLVEENTMNLSKRSGDKELFYGTLVEENSTYIKIDNLKYKGFDLYYKKQISNIMSEAIFFNDNYQYFYKDPNSKVVKPLGYYKGIINKSTDCRYYDIDYYVYDFSEGEVISNEKSNIYSIEIAKQYDNMILIEDMLYENYDVYYLFNIRENSS